MPYDQQHEDRALARLNADLNHDNDSPAFGPEVREHLRAMRLADTIGTILAVLIIAGFGVMLGYILF